MLSGTDSERAISTTCTGTVSDVVVTALLGSTGALISTGMGNSSTRRSLACSVALDSKRAISTNCTGTVSDVEMTVLLSSVGALVALGIGNGSTRRSGALVRWGKYQHAGVSYSSSSKY